MLLLRISSCWIRERPAPSAHDVERKNREKAEWWSFGAKLFITTRNSDNEIDEVQEKSISSQSSLKISESEEEEQDGDVDWSVKDHGTQNHDVVDYDEPKQLGKRKHDHVSRKKTLLDMDYKSMNKFEQTELLWYEIQLLERDLIKAKKVWMTNVQKMHFVSART